ncbi:hypothetical protein ABMC88_17725 [Sulfitobacter sp. HNIBRBA2951]|uniref:hypothetical protein n=1 Tax=Sulfitobacter aquimarinus TaxID=3158557 RepID=UPI0032DEEC71
MQHDDLTQDLKTKAHDIGHDAKEAAFSQAERKAEALRDDAAARVSNAADAADAAANTFDPDSLQARAAQQVADQVEGIAQQLRTADLGSVAHEVSSFARKNPALFIGGAALLGFAATRFLKARDPQRVDYGRVDADPWGAPDEVKPTPRGYDVAS